MNGSAVRSFWIRGSSLFSVLASYCVVAVAAQGEPITRLGLKPSQLEYPSIARLVFGFALTAALLILGVWVWRRLSGGWSGLGAADPAIKVLARSQIGAGLRVVLLQVGNQRIVLAESRQHMQLLMLPSTESELSELESGR